MKSIEPWFKEVVAQTPPAIQQEVKMEFALSNRIYNLMQARGLNKRDLAQALGKRPSEVTRWISGQHNFTVRTLAMLSAFFGEPLIHVAE